MVRASTYEQSSVIVTTLNRGAVYSPTSDSARNMGRNAAEVVSDEINMGMRSSFAESMAASNDLLPADICTMMDLQPREVDEDYLAAMGNRTQSNT